MENTEKYANNPNYLHYGYPINMNSNIKILIAEKWWRYSDSLNILCYTLYFNLPKFSKRIPKLPNSSLLGQLTKLKLIFMISKYYCFRVKNGDTVRRSERLFVFLPGVHTALVTVTPWCTIRKFVEFVSQNIVAKTSLRTDNVIQYLIQFESTFKILLKLITYYKLVFKQCVFWLKP